MKGMEKRTAQNKKTNFDRLASDLTKTERKDMLNKINPADIEIKIPTAAEEKEKKDKAAEKEFAANTKKGLAKQFSREPVFKRLVVWLKSVFLNVSVEEVYNNAVISVLARQIEHVFPGVIDYKHRMLGNSLYNGLMDLRNVQDFFKNEVSVFDGDSGLFYYLLGEILMPDYVQEIKKVCDPFQYSLDKPLGQDARANLLSKLEEYFNSMPADAKDKISRFSQSFEWMRMFTKLPVSSMMSKFSVANEGRKCMFVQIRSEYPEFAKVIGTKFSFSDEFIRALFMASGEVKNLWSCALDSVPHEKIDDLVRTAVTEISAITMFTKSVPVRDLGRVVFENSLYAAETFSPGDNWVQKYFEEWKIVFDQRWRLWNKEFKKEEVKKKQKIFFGISDFQKFPYHPWQKYSDDFPFKYDISLGFVNYYFKQEYPKYAGILNVVTLEGDFQIKENRHEFTDLVADFNGIMDNIDRLVRQVGVGGDYGSEFIRYDNSIKNRSNREKLSTIIQEIEDDAALIVETFLKAGHTFEILVRAMLGEHSTVYYGPLTNLNKIMGRDNREFRETLERYVHSIKYAVEVLTAMCEVDSMKV